MTVRRVAAASLLFTALAAPASAQQPETSRELRGQLWASINSAGLQNTLELSWTRPASTSTHPLLAGAHFGAGIVHALTPTQMRLGGWVEYSPLSILDVRAGVDPSVYFGTFNSLQGFDAYADPFDTDARKARAIAIREFAGSRFGLPRPKLTLVVARYLDDPSKEGQWTVAAAIGFRSRR
ncbi:MAG: hypothetical protein WD690_14360 [Vicinamibacterales bacterium]